MVVVGLGGVNHTDAVDIYRTSRLDFEIDFAFLTFVFEGGYLTVTLSLADNAANFVATGILEHQLGTAVGVLAVANRNYCLRANEQCYDITVAESPTVLHVVPAA